MNKKIEVLRKIINIVDPESNIYIEANRDYYRVSVRSRNSESINCCENTLEVALHRALKSAFSKLEAILGLKQADLAKAMSVKMEASEYLSE